METELAAQDLEWSARALGVQVLIVKAGSEDAFDAAFSKIVQSGAGALLIGGSDWLRVRAKALLPEASMSIAPRSQDWLGGEPRSIVAADMLNRRGIRTASGKQ